jgi:hypothetical protein
MDKWLNPEQIVVPILGMHRSGTSMFTRALNLLGLELGQPLMAPSPGNSRGYWENLFFVSCNQELLRFIGSNTDGFDFSSSLLQISKQSTRIELAHDCKEQLKSHIKGTFQSSRWGWKDPRTVLLIRFWIQLLRDMGCQDFRPAIIVRHPHSSVCSLIRQGELPPVANQKKVPAERLALDVWKAYNLIVQGISEEMPCFIGIQEWLLDPDYARDELKRCAFFIGLDENNIDAALEWIDPSLVHHQPNVENLVDDEALNIYESLKATALRQRTAWQQQCPAAVIK